MKGDEIVRLNQECVRDLLLAIEEHINIDPVYMSNLLDISSKYLQLNGIHKYEIDELVYTANRLKEAGYINGNEDVHEDENKIFSDFWIISITWNGHKFLDTIRDNEVWSNTKDIISKFSSVSLSLVETIASNVITQIINRHLHLNQ